MDKLTEATEYYLMTLLNEVGDDPCRDGVIDTPARLKKAMRFMLSGYKQDLHEIVGEAMFDVGENAGSSVQVNGIEFYSLCEHHVLPFFGNVNVEYIPEIGKPVIGLSKIPRIVNMFARRLQIQERLTTQIGEAIKQITMSKSIRVEVTGKHLCCSMRGVEKQNVEMKTVFETGKFLRI